METTKHSRLVTTIGPICITIAACLWGIDGVLRRSLFSLPSETIIFFEHFVGVLILLPFVFRNILNVRFSRKEWIVMALIAICSGVVGTLFFTKALLATGFISFSVVFLIQKLQPIFAMTTARIFLKETFPKNFILWASIALVSAYFVTFPSGIVNFNTGSGTIIAGLFALIAAVAWGGSTTLSKIALQEQTPLITTFVRFGLTAVLALILVLVTGHVHTLTTITPMQVGTLIIIAFSTGMVALLIYYRGLRTTPVRVATILELAFPLVAVCIDGVIYHHYLLWSQWIAVAVLLGAMYQITRQNHE